MKAVFRCAYKDYELPKVTRYVVKDVYNLKKDCPAAVNTYFSFK